MISLSAVIITYNEEHNIKDCLDSLNGIVDEILVIDSFSTDKTVAIARQIGAKVIENKFDGHIEQKNFAVASASYDWVISLDADERLSKEARKAVYQIKEKQGADAYTFNRLNNYCGKWIKHSGWYPDQKIRLWNRNKGKWGGVNPHDSVKMNDASKLINTHTNILHYTYRNIEEHIAQINKFTTIASEQLYKKRKNASLIRVTVYPFWVFLKCYIVQFGFLDGFYGFVLSINSAYYKFLKYIKLRELNNKRKL